MTNVNLIPFSIQMENVWFLGAHSNLEDSFSITHTLRSIEPGSSPNVQGENDIINY